MRLRLYGGGETVSDDLLRSLYAPRPRLAARHDGSLYERPPLRLRDLLPPFTTARGAARFYRPPPISVILGELRAQKLWRSWRFWLTGRPARG